MMNNVAVLMLVAHSRGKEILCCSKSFVVHPELGKINLGGPLLLACIYMKGDPATVGGWIRKQARIVFAHP